MAELAKHRPFIASVMDWERPDQLSNILEWAEDAAQYVEVVMIIPKVIGGIAQLPRCIGGKSVRLGYSVPTKYGGTVVPYSEFHGWPVHLLGGSPHRQRRLGAFMSVVSLDGNYAQMMAVRYNEFWYRSRWHELSDHGGNVAVDAPYEAFRRSCHNIVAMWTGRRQSVLPNNSVNPTAQPSLFPRG